MTVVVPASADVTGVVLAGGLARRLQGPDTDGAWTDKALLPLAGRPMIAHVIDRLGPQVGRLLISANRNLAIVRRLGYPVLPDTLPDHPGPLAGLLAAFQASASPWLVQVPCDAPLLPGDLVARLLAGAQAASAPAAFARAAGRAHPTFAVVHRDLAQRLEADLRSGTRRVLDWLDSVGAVAVDFGDGAGFTNVNTPEDLQALLANVPTDRRDLPSAASAEAPSCGPPASEGRPAAPTALGFQDALGRLLGAMRPMEVVEYVPPSAACGRVLARDMVATVDLPPFDNAAMDGYAVRAADLPSKAPGEDGTVRLTIVGRAMAGHPYRGTLGPGQAVRIMTGAELPAGADTVVVQEAAIDCNDGSVRLPASSPPGRHCRRRGEDQPAGGIALAAGRRLGPIDLGVLAAQGVTRLPVFRRLRVGLLSTGDELLAPGSRPQAGRVYDANGPMLAAALGTLDVTVVDLGRVGDDEAAFGRRLAEMAGTVDAVISTAGVSAGEADVVRKSLQMHGSVEFWRIRLRPGKPFAFGHLAPNASSAGDSDGARTAWFGLPGNPVAAIISFAFLVRPALQRAMGIDPIAGPAVWQLPSATTIAKQAGRTEVLRARIESVAGGGLSVRVDEDQGAAGIAGLGRADALVFLDEPRGAVAVGESIPVIALHGLGLATI